MAGEMLRLKNGALKRQWERRSETVAGPKRQRHPDDGEWKTRNAFYGAPEQRVET
jgi:hypothetical protein